MSTDEKSGESRRTEAREAGDEATAGGGDPGRGEDAEESGAGAREKISDGVRQGIGVLSAFKEALEETIQEARDRGELSSDRAKAVVRDAMDRVREAAGDARERLEFASQDDFDRLRDEVAELRVRLENLEHRMPQDENVGPSRPAGTESGTGEAEGV